MLICEVQSSSDFAVKEEEDKENKVGVFLFALLRQTESFIFIIVECIVHILEKLERKHKVYILYVHNLKTNSDIKRIYVQLLK